MKKNLAYNTSNITLMEILKKSSQIQYFLITNKTEIVFIFFFFFLKLDTFHLVMFLWFHKITFLFVIHIINGVVLDFQAEALKPQVKFFWLDCWVL